MRRAVLHSKKQAKSGMPVVRNMMFKKHPRYMLQTYGGETLKKISEPVCVFDRELGDLARFMIKATHALNGIGLAAVQIGVHKRLIVLDIPQSSMGNPPTPGELQLLPQMPLALVNPRIVEFGGAVTACDEGCLSVPEIYAEVMRPQLIKVQAQDLNGNELEFECGGLLARCIQHEVDHLDGLTFIDRLTPEVRSSVDRELKDLDRRGKKFNYQRNIKI
ncbi:MAG: peptide deformylase [Lentisphaerae bacterium]|nr:peptide deformylase [Lentisphaerota bacterium]